MKSLELRLLILLLTASLGIAAEIREDAAEFLKMYNSIVQPLSRVANEAAWQAAIDVTDEHTGTRIGSAEALSTFAGSVYVIEKSKKLLAHKDQLDDLTVRQLEAILLGAAESPGTIPEIIAEKVRAEARQQSAQDSFVFQYKTSSGSSNIVTPNIITDILIKSTNMEERRAIWEASREIGIPLRPGLVNLQRLRNRVAQEMGFNSYFAMKVADFGMSVEEMKALTERLFTDIRPLYEQLHCWARHRLAERYGQPIPKTIPAHWLGNRWGQEWPGLVKGTALEGDIKKTPEWIVEQGERFYVSLGWQQLPKSFYAKSDLYELPSGDPRRKNTHASAWHIDLENDVRSIMSVKSDFAWLETTHHELGHIYYYLAYSNPNVPVLLRTGANRAFHEAIGDLIGIAARQVPYLKEIGLIDPAAKINSLDYLLDEALQAIVFIPWSAGVMTSWEHDFYELNLPTNQYNQRWWEYVAKYQGITPPEPRDERFCDPATKTHINDDAAEYYDYALAFAIKYQLHMHIAKNILKQDPRSCNYYGNQEVGRFLWEILKVGKTADWRKLLQETTGQEISAQPMLEYFQPLMAYLKKENEGRTVGW
ncbi:MAG: M2 family metallopeptidase [Verrucomicrobiota bacterium]|nr:M2 family metallopeptidase [Verrucomicrobiota bacterium]